MLRNNVWNYLKGYVNIRIDGLSIEKFINMAVTRKIWLKDVKRLSNTSMLATVSIRGFFALRPVARKLKLKISIVDKNGYPFLLSKIKRRKVFVFGIIFCFLFVMYISSFIWVIDIHGNEKVSTKTIEEVLARCGVKPGVFKYGIKPSEIERKLLIDIDDLAWAGVMIQGTRISVSVVEKKKPPKVKTDNAPSNIVASKDAIIDRIITFQGDPVVKDGDTVKAGQILVTGIIQREGVPTRFVHSSAIIDARTWYEEEAMIPIKDSKFVDTDKKMANLWLDVNEKVFPIYVREVPYKYYSKSISRTPILWYGDKKFPLWIVKETYKEKRLVEKSMPPEVARKKAEEMAYEKVYKKLPHNAIIISKKVIASSVYNGVARAKVLVEVKEDIARQEKIEVKEEYVERINDSNR
ncbi:similar to stage IV sporulation protein [Caldanaerobius fijiensis DSM 17918]|uniref:Similar to stage IV sporulation protein n=1 Tax=Caldanaerobius fijiensis DSM 17918 TaxID=1121256 RepID=A0A1M4SE37_9THEO|nr:similar to stage IV sporulation protein [Caldanaerobius fijiensis DSM 17918]